MIEAFQAATPTSPSRWTPARAAPTATTSSRRGCPPATWPKSSTTTTARCCRRSSRSRTSRPGRPALGEPARQDLRRLHQGRDGKLYGGPWGTAFGGGVLYNIPRLQEAGSADPEDLGRVHGEQRGDQEGRQRRPSRADLRGDLDLAAVRARRLPQRRGPGPDFAEEYTAGKAKYANTPAALAGFQHIQEVQDAGYFNKDFASAKLNDGIKAVATGTAAHYPQLGGFGQHRERRPRQVEGRRLLPPARRRRRNERHDCLARQRLYIPKTVRGRQAGRRQEVHRLRDHPGGL